MAEQRPLGCGLFSEEEWAELVAGSGPDAQADAAGRRELLEHVRTCAACRAELAALARLSQQVRHVLAEADATLHDAVREAFVAGVMAQVRQTRAGGGAPAGNAWAAGDGSATGDGASVGGRPDTGEGAAGGAEGALVRRMRRRSRALRGARWPAWAAAAAMILLAVLAGGLPWTTLLMPEHMRSTGQVWPGGTILAVTDTGTAHAAGLSAAGVVQAASGGPETVTLFSAPEAGQQAARLPAAPFSAEDGAVSLFSAPETTHEPAPEPGAPLRVPGGFVSAVSGAPPEPPPEPASEGGSANP